MRAKVSVELNANSCLISLQLLYWLFGKNKHRLHKPCSGQICTNGKVKVRFASCVNHQSWSEERGEEFPRTTVSILSSNSQQENKSFFEMNKGASAWCCYWCHDNSREVLWSCLPVVCWSPRCLCGHILSFQVFKFQGFICHLCLDQQSRHIGNIVQSSRVNSSEITP